MTFAEEIKSHALSLGFDACGICRAEYSGLRDDYLRWISENCHGEMGYLARNIDKRLDPRLLVEGAKSIVCVALNYYPRVKQREGCPQFAYYAYGQDYHNVLRTKLKLLFDFVRCRCPEAQGRCFVDSAPVLERFWAARAGLGFVGKNTSLIIPGKGSYFFLGELMLDLELEPDSPLAQSCGKCRRCLDACPPKAIEEAYWLNAKKCISYQTIEHKGEIDEAVQLVMGDRVYGCDSCQQACPWNCHAKPHGTPELMPSEEFLSLDLDGLQRLTEEDFERI
ncbi:MAG: tRNA epoxyqueuosine(34) reductase QueG, partial [Dysgonamonadaceae bacterium]|nr:tRNA epoxyqueuosine(34) reductase QueG [Dysgonamonadaceae bacterium]